MPSRIEKNLGKYPGLVDDLYLYNQLKKSSVYAKDLKGLKDEFLTRGNSRKVEYTPEVEAKMYESTKKEYIELIKDDISKGYKFPEAVLNYDKSFEKAVNSRARYEKGLHTSFSADDTRIVFDDKNRIVAGMKRQDGKELLPHQKEEIINGVLQTQKALGIDLNQLSKDERWVFAHLNGKNPFLKKNTAGLYRKGEGSISISLGGTESFESIIDGKKVQSKVNTTVAHEIGHALDYSKGKDLLDYETYSKLRNSFKPVKFSSRGDKYWKNQQEVTARAIEEYVAISEGHFGKFDQEGYWSKDIFETLIKPKIKKAVDEHFSQYKT